MARKTNIVSFDDARAASRARRSNSSFYDEPDDRLARIEWPSRSGRSSSATSGRGFVQGQPASASEDRTVQRASRGVATEDAFAEGGVRSSGSRSSSRRASRRSEARDAGSRASDNRGSASDWRLPDLDDDPKAVGKVPSWLAATSDRDDSRSDVVSDYEAEPGDEEAAGRGRAEDRREQRRRQRAKMRADRMFTRQFGDDASAAQLEGSQPRAALYEGQMGASQRKSARMQKASFAAPQSAKINPAGWLSNLHVSKAALRAATAVICLVLVGVFLYAPAQQYYQAQRDRDRLAAEYAELEQRNDVLNSQNQALSSKAGMEDAVRQKYGYVIEGDETAIVTGLTATATGKAHVGETVEANVLSSTVKAPEEWYTPYLDAFFGVS